MSSHCRHCSPDCSGCAPDEGSEPHGCEYAQWMFGHCPACAASERIAVECERRALAEAGCGDERGLLMAAAIARG